MLRRPGSRAADDLGAGRVRRAGAGDLERLGDLWDALCAHHAALDPAFATHSHAPQWVRADFEGALGHPERAVWVFEAGGRTRGLCAAQLNRSALAREAARVEITDLVVEPAARGRGIGRTLVGTALAWALEEGAARIEVRVAAANPGAQRFWRRNGFGDFVDVLQRRL